MQSFLDHSARTWKRTENGSVELDNRAVHQRKRRNKPDRQREDGQAIFKAQGARLVSDEAAEKAFYRAGPP
jgi:hypothetical protein